MWRTTGTTQGTLVYETCLPANRTKCAGRLVRGGVRGHTPQYSIVSMSEDTLKGLTAEVPNSRIGRIFQYCLDAGTHCSASSRSDQTSLIWQTYWPFQPFRRLQLSIHVSLKYPRPLPPATPGSIIIYLSIQMASSAYSCWFQRLPGYFNCSIVPSIVYLTGNVMRGNALGRMNYFVFSREIMRPMRK